ncbi:lactoylglutathione lyase / glyoxalase I family protein [Wolffia australiana]
MASAQLRCFSLIEPLACSANRQIIPRSSPSAGVRGKRLKRFSLKISAKSGDLAAKESGTVTIDRGIGVVSIHHVGLLCENLEKSLEFYQDLLGLEINEDRPHEKLPYRGAWLWVGSEMIHLMELPNPDPLTGRPEHGGRDRHACIAIKDVNKLKEIFDGAGIQYTLSRSGRPAIFARDPDGNALEFTQVD